MYKNMWFRDAWSVKHILVNMDPNHWNIKNYYDVLGPGGLCMAKNERRNGERLRSRNTFQFRKIHTGGDDNDLQNMDGLLVDYSTAGIRFVTCEQLAKNTSLLIQLNLDGLDCDEVDWRQLWETGNAESLNVVGSVMWCLASDHEPGRFEVGTRFIRKAEEKID